MVTQGVLGPLQNTASYLYPFPNMGTTTRSTSDENQARDADDARAGAARCCDENPCPGHDGDAPDTSMPDANDDEGQPGRRRDRHGDDLGGSAEGSREGGGVATHGETEDGDSTDDEPDGPPPAYNESVRQSGVGRLNMQPAGRPRGPENRGEYRNRHDRNRRDGHGHESHPHTTAPPPRSSDTGDVSKMNRYRKEKKELKQQALLLAQANAVLAQENESLKQRDERWQEYCCQLEGKLGDKETLLRKSELSVEELKARLKQSDTEVKLLRDQNLAEAQNRQGLGDDTIVKTVESDMKSLIIALARNSKSEKLRDLHLIEGLLKESTVGEGLSAKAVLAKKAQRRLVRSIIWRAIVQHIFAKPFFWLEDHDAGGADAADGPLSHVVDIYETLKKSSKKVAAAWRCETLRSMSECGVDLAEQYRPFCDRFSDRLEEKLRQLDSDVVPEKLRQIVYTSAQFSVSLSRDLATYEFEMDGLVPTTQDTEDAEAALKSQNWLVTIPRLVKWGNSRGGMYETRVVLVDALVEKIQ